MGSLAQFFVDEEPTNRIEMREGMERVLSNSSDEWKKHYRQMANDWFDKLSIGAVFQAYDIREYVTNQGLEAPHHRNVWGAIANSILREWKKFSRIEKIGISFTKNPSSHRNDVEYRKISK